jgi:hypothetical protein
VQIARLVIRLSGASILRMDPRQRQLEGVLVAVVEEPSPAPRQGIRGSTLAILLGPKLETAATPMMV